MNIKQYSHRRKLLKRNNFFENVCCDKRDQKDILYWMFWLHLKSISINKFSDLVGKYGNIQFPIKVSSGDSTLLTIVDNHGDVYYIDYSPYDYTKLETYSIIETGFLCNKKITFQLTQKNEIILKINVLLKYEDNTYKDDRFSLIYDYPNNTTTATFKQESSKIEIVYEQNRKLDIFLFERRTPQLYYFDNYFDNVFLILISIREFAKINPISIKATKHSEVSSEIVISDGIVKKYSFTKGICLHQETLSQNVEDFIQETFSQIVEDIL